jgi:hypothetical protein
MTDGSIAPREDTDDYDLLTFSEVAARLTEELAEATAELDGMRADAAPDTERIRRSEQRVALLQDSIQRYRQAQQRNGSFARWFGTHSDPPSDRRPKWR